MYGPDLSRKRLDMQINGGYVMRLYSDGCEYEDNDGNTRELHYITAYGEIVAIYEKTPSGDHMYYVLTDHLGSVSVILDENQNVVQELSYDAWGNRRDPYTLEKLTTPPADLITNRGFTGHEHMDEFGLINMNGRMYDPKVGRFLSPDLFVGNSGFTQSYNRYSYCLNNPLMFVDPTGWKEQFKKQTDDLAEIPSYNNLELIEHTKLSFDNEGYRYDWSNQVYYDVATGQIVDPQVAIDWLLSEGNGITFYGKDAQDIFRALIALSEGGLDNYVMDDRYAVAGDPTAVTLPSKTGTPWITYAYEEFNSGVAEISGDKHNSRIIEYLKSTGLSENLLKDETGWCAAFVNWALKQAGIQGAGARPSNWKTWGQSLSDPIYGAIAIFKGSHVGFVVGKKGDKLIILHGNWSNKVSLSDYISPGDIDCYVYPKGYKPATTFP